MRESLNEKEVKIASFPKSDKEEVRVSETTYLGKTYIDLRIFKKSFGEYHPTNRGITISKRLVPHLCEALTESGFRSLEVSGITQPSLL